MATKGVQRPGGSPPPSIPHDRLVFLLLALVGSKVVATVKGGQRFSGILSAATADGEVNLALRQAQLVDDPSAPLRPSLLIQAKDLQELSAVDISLDSRPSERDAFKTDTEVTGLASDRREKELQAWGAGTGLGGDGGIEDSLGGLSLDDEQRGQGGGKAWDQFATNERLYGTRTDYHEELYTTKLDRSGADYRQREQRAAQLEREILKGGGGALANNAHIAEERGVVDDSGLTEEDRYSGVIRGSGAYVPPGARKTALARSAANGSTNGLPSSSSPTPAPAPTSHSLAASAASAQLQDPSIISVTSRLPVASSTSRIPAAVPGSTTTVPGADGKPAAPTVEGSFRQFVSFERQRLMEKKNALAKAAERQDKDSKLASLLEFSQTFKLKSPMPADIAEIAGHGERKPIPASSTSKPTTTLTPTANVPSTSASTSVSPAVSPVRIARALTPVSGAAPAPASASAPAAKQPPRFSGASTLIAEIPPFNPNRAKAKAAEAAAAAAAGKSAAPTAAALAKTPSSGAGAAAAPAPSASPALSASTSSKINPNAPAFVFRPNPNASSFTPGFAARKPAEPQGPVNPFFGTKQIKKGSSSMHVKEDFTPFKTGLVSEPVTILPNWSFTGKPYRSMYPHAPSPTPPPMGMPSGAGGPEDGGGSDLPGSLPMHHGAPPPPPPQGYGGAMGVYGGGGFGPQGGFNPRFAPPQPPMQHLPPGAMNGNMQFPPPPPPQHFAPPPPPNMGFGGAPPGPPMFNSPQMQPQPGAYMRYTPFPPGGPGGPGGPPQGGAQ